MKLSLAAVPAFQFVVGDGAKQLAKMAKLVAKAPHEAVLLHGETVPGIYIVAEGGVGVYPPGAPRPLVQLGVGASFGEMSFLEQAKASATIRAEAPGTKLALLNRNDLIALVERDATFAAAFYRGLAVVLSQKLRTTTERIGAELAAGRALLQDLDTASLAALPSPPDEMSRDNQRVAEDLERLSRLIGEQAKRTPERAAAFAEMELAVTAVKTRTAQLLPRLARHMAVIGAFVKQMEEFLLLRD